MLIRIGLIGSATALVVALASSMVGADPLFSTYSPDLTAKISSKSQRIVLGGAEDQRIFRELFLMPSLDDTVIKRAIYLIIRNLGTVGGDQRTGYYDFLTTIYATDYIGFLSSPGLLTEKELIEFSKFLVTRDPSALKGLSKIDFVKYLVELNNPITVGALISRIDTGPGGGSSDLLASDPNSDRGNLIYEVLEYARKRPNPQFRDTFHRMSSSHRFAPEPTSLEMNLVTALASMGDRSVEPIARRWVETAQSVNGKMAGIEALAYFGDVGVVQNPKYVDILTHALMSQSWFSKTVTALANVESPATKGILLDLYNDSGHKYTFTEGGFTAERYTGVAVASLAKLKYHGVVEFIYKDVRSDYYLSDEDFEAIRYLDDDEKQQVARFIISEIRTKREPYYTNLLKPEFVVQTLSALEFLGFPTFKVLILNYLRADYAQNGTVPVSVKQVVARNL